MPDKYDAAIAYLTEHPEEITVIERLERGRERIAKGWCQGVGVLAKDLLGKSVPPVSWQATQWTASGAVGGPWTIDEDAEVYLLSAGGFSNCFDLIDYNNALERTQQDILDLYGRAIALAKEEQTP